MPGRKPNRSVPSRDHVCETSIGNIMAIRRLTTTVKATATMPAGYRFAAIRNDGANDILINFNTDTTSNYMTVKAGTSLPFAVEIVEGTLINYISPGGASQLEAWIWG